MLAFASCVYVHTCWKSEQTLQNRVQSLSLSRRRGESWESLRACLPTSLYVNLIIRQSSSRDRLAPVPARAPWTFHTPQHTRRVEIREITFTSVVKESQLANSISCSPSDYSTLNSDVRQQQAHIIELSCTVEHLRTTLTTRLESIWILKHGFVGIARMSEFKRGTLQILHVKISLLVNIILIITLSWRRHIGNISCLTDRGHRGWRTFTKAGRV